MLLPKEMSDAYNAYYDSFKAVNPGKNLLVLPHMGYGEVEFVRTCVNLQISYARGAQTFILTATTAQIVILNLFNGMSCQRP